MPIDKVWSTAKVSHVKNNVPQSKGIYELKNWGKIVYIGSSRNLKRRLLEHINDRNPTKYRDKNFGILSSPVKHERKHFDRHVEKYGNPPQWNDQRP